MSSGRFTKATAVTAGAKGGRVSRLRRLSLEKVEAELGELNSIEDAQRWLRTIAMWTAAGMLTGAAGNVCVRSVEVWVKANESKLTREVVESLRNRLHELEQKFGQRNVKAIR